MNIAIIGDGHVGSALARGLKKAGHQVESTGNDQDRIRAIVKGAEVVVAAVPFAALDDVVHTLGDLLRDKILVDVTNALTGDFNLALGFSTSGAEELQKKAPAAKVVKAFNTLFASHMDSGHVKGQPLSAFIASDDARAKSSVMELARSIGFDAVDAGGLQNARLLEPLGFLNIQLGFTMKMGTDIGIRLVH